MPLNKVLFASQRPYERAENIRAVYDAYDGEKAFVQTDAARRHPLMTSGEYPLLVIDEYPEVSPGTCILLWHAIEGGKRIGFDQPGPYLRREHSRLINYAVTSGTGVVNIVANNSGVDRSRVLPLGMPRTDAYVGKKKGDGGTILASKRSYLYAPTFRNARETPAFDVDFDWLDYELTDDELFVVKSHPRGYRMLDREYRHIVEFPSTMASAAFLYDCDVVITDYSSIIFDGYLLGKPSVLFEKLFGFTETRGMYMNYPHQYSSRFCTNDGEMLALARSAASLTDTERQCIRKVADMCDGHATERVCSLIREVAYAF